MTPSNDPTGFDRRPLLICFSHLRWNFVFQRPQQIMQRLGRDYRVLFWEEPVFDAVDQSRLELRREAGGVEIAVPHLVPDDGAEVANLQRLLEEFIGGDEVAVRWYYTPMMLPFSRSLTARCTVYDCMDELANFRFAPDGLLALETELLAASDIVFTGGYSLYEAKRDRHPNVLPFPSSVDVDHFARARPLARPLGGTAPRLGYYGVIDERLDLELVAHLADARPEWSIEMIGPVVKIAAEDLPQRPNIHYVGPRSYDELPLTLSGWHVALMPFAINDATRFISPTKTPEYLAAGKPVVSTPITDVIRHYGRLDRVSIAGEPDAFVAACDAALSAEADAGLAEADAVLSTMSWDATVARMAAAIVSVPAASRTECDYLVVGAGFAGAVLAERLASEGRRVLVVDRRSHIGGNAYDRVDDAGILIHQYGPHIFHTNSAEIFDYLSNFTEWRPYEHRVLAHVDDKLVPVPINRTTLNALYNLDLKTDAEAERYLAGRAEPVPAVHTSEDVVVSAIGRELYEKFFRGYTRKQWGLDPSELDKSVTARVPTRTNDDDRYFTDTFQAMPAEGYTAMFERMLRHPNIEVRLGVEFETVKATVDYDHLIFTGPIDEYFGHRYGKLPYRSLTFQHETIDREWFQDVGTVNYPAEETAYTRISEYKHLTGQQAPVTSITYEFPSAEGDPYYPIPRPENQALFKRYEALALSEPDVTFVGRLATYRYYNMDQVVGQALATFRRLREREVEPVLVAAE